MTTTSTISASTSTAISTEPITFEEWCRSKFFVDMLEESDIVIGKDIVRELSNFSSGDQETIKELMEQCEFHLTSKDCTRVELRRLLYGIVDAEEIVKNPDVIQRYARALDFFQFCEAADGLFMYVWKNYISKLGRYLDMFIIGDCGDDGISAYVSSATLAIRRITSNLALHPTDDIVVNYIVDVFLIDSLVTGYNISKSCRIEDIYLSEFKMTTPNDRFEKLLPRMPHLQWLVATKQLPAEIGNALPVWHRMDTLFVGDNVKYLRDEHYENFLARDQYTGIRHLGIIMHEPSEAVNARINKYLPTLTSLVHLNAPYIRQLNDGALKTLVNLQTLGVDNCRLLTDEFYINLTQLKKLAINSCHGITGENFHRLPELRILEASNAIKLKGCNLNKLKNLRELDVSQCNSLEWTSIGDDETEIPLEKLRAEQASVSLEVLKCATNLVEASIDRNDMDADELRAMLPWIKEENLTLNE